MKTVAVICLALVIMFAVMELAHAAGKDKSCKGQPNMGAQCPKEEEMYYYDRYEKDCIQYAGCWDADKDVSYRSQAACKKACM